MARFYYIYKKNKHQQGENHALYNRKIVHKCGIGWIWINISDLDKMLSEGWKQGKGNLKRGIM